MKWFVYNLLFAAVYPFLLPGFLLRMLRRGGYAARMGDRFALYPADFPGACADDGDSPIWIHAVSVGEVQIAAQLMREWRKAEPGVRFCFSTTSSTGWKIAEKELAEPGSGPSASARDFLIYNPLDFPNFVKSALNRIRPRAIVLTESEIWPNFIMRAKKAGVPLFLVNARISDRSAPRYRLARWFFKDVFGSFTEIFAQSDLDAGRIRAAMRKEDAGKVSVTGSFKFDVARRDGEKEAELREWIGSYAKILLGGSIWPGEDKVLLDIYREILKRIAAHPGASEPILVLAPRHFEKADDVEANIRAAGFGCVRRSRGDRRGERSVFLCDTTGEMMGLFGICDAAFVGKSLCAHGSQNMIEPCLCGKPTFVGPFTENFRPVMSDLLSSRAIVQVKDAAELGEKLLLHFTGGGDTELGERAYAAVMKRRGTTPRCVDAIRNAIEKVNHEEK